MKRALEFESSEDIEMTEGTHEQKPSLGINQLPYDVFIAIFAHLDCSTRCMVRRVCSFWNSVLSFEFPLLNFEIPTGVPSGLAFDRLVSHHRNAPDDTIATNHSDGQVSPKLDLSTLRTIVVTNPLLASQKRLLNTRAIAYLSTSFRNLREIAFVNGKVNFWLLLDLPPQITEVCLKNIILEDISSIDYFDEGRRSEPSLSFEVTIKKASVILLPGSSRFRFNYNTFRPTLEEHLRKLVEETLPVYSAGQKQLIGLDIKKLHPTKQNLVLRIIRLRENELSAINLPDIQDLNFGWFTNSTLRELELFIPNSYDSYSHWQNLDRFSSSKLFHTS